MVHDAFFFPSVMGPAKFWIEIKPAARVQEWMYYKTELLPPMMDVFLSGK